MEGAVLSGGMPHFRRVSSRPETNARLPLPSRAMPAPSTMKTASLVAAFLLVTHLPAMARPYVLESESDIKEAPSAADEVHISTLPIEAYPLLAKFRKIRRIDFYNKNGNGADDGRLQALARLKFPTLKDVCLLNCPAVTDVGIVALASFPSIKELQLEGTSITDRAVQILLDQMGAPDLNVANCKGVTFKGLRLLATSARGELGFSTENVNQAEVLELINILKPGVEYCAIVDQTKKLDAAPIEAACKKRGIKLDLRSKGALQEMAEP